MAIGNGLMEGQITYEKVGQEMMDKGQEISRIGSHINFQEKKIANIMNLNKEIDKVLQDEEEE